MSPRKSRVNHKHWYHNQKGKNYTNIKQTTRKKKSLPHNKKVVTSKEIGLEVNAEKIKSGDQNAGENQNIKMDNKAFERL